MNQVNNDPYPKKNTTGVYYQNQNINNNNNTLNAPKTKSVSDEKLETIKQILKSEILNEQKITEISEVLGL